MSRTLGRAFYEDPIMKWLLPDDAQRAKSSPRMFATMTRHHFLAGGGSEVATGRIYRGGGALGPARTMETVAARRTAHDARVHLAFGRRVPAGREVADLMKKNSSEEPHWYLAVIAAIRPSGERALGRP